MNEVTPKKNKSWYKKKKWWFTGGLAALVILAFVFMRGGDETTYEKITAVRSDLTQEVSVTGKIKPAQAVDLQFESSGRISSLNYKVGSKVNSGATLASLENQDLQAAVTSARADLERTVKNFNSLNDPTLSSSLRVELENAKNNLEQVQKKADGDLASKYNSAVNTLSEAMNQVNSSSAILEYIRKNSLEGKYTWDDDVKKYQLETAYYIEAVKKAYPEVSSPGSPITPSSYTRIDKALQEMLNTAQSLRGAFDFLQIGMESNTSFISSATDRTSIYTEAAALSSDISALSAAIRGITDQVISNAKNISDARAKLATAEASFPTGEDILQKESALLSAQSQLRKTLIVAPFSGTIGKIDGERGQTVNSSDIIVTLISSAKYQIEADITEIDIGKVRVGNPAMLTLDAFGSQTVFSAKVSSIDRAATIVDGVTTYKVIFDFDGPLDEGVLPNMTANIDIETAKKDNIISIPQRAVISRNDQRFVRIFRGDKEQPEERAVELGMSGKDGYVEVTAGLNEGEEVITFINN